MAGALARTARLARDDADHLDALAADADPGTPALAVVAVADLPAAVRRRVLRRWLGRHRVGDLSLAHVLAVEELLVRWHGQRGVPLPGGTVTRRGGELLWQAVGRG